MAAQIPDLLRAAIITELRNEYARKGWVMPSPPPWSTLEVEYNPDTRKLTVTSDYPGLNHVVFVKDGMVSTSRESTDLMDRAIKRAALGISKVLARGILCSNISRLLSKTR